MRASIAPSHSSKSRSVATAVPHQDLRRALLDATLEESAAVGPQAISFREIARRLGVTTAAPYYHFRDKGEMLKILATEGYSRLLAVLKRAEAEGHAAADKVSALTRAYLNFGRTERGYYGIMFYREVVEPSCSTQHEGPGAECFDLICDLIVKVNPSLRADEVSERTVSVWSFLHGILTLSSSGPLSTRLAPEDEDRVAIEVCQRIIGLPEGRARNRR